jgi:7,8-dihydro-6-hydroxymethylpterin dimethyltransferase
MDVNTLDVRSVKRSCIHIVHPETLNVIPFDTYNLFYRPGLKRPDFIKD